MIYTGYSNKSEDLQMKTPREYYHAIILYKT